MARRRKDIVWPHLNNAGGDLSKLWYVEYSLRNPVSGKMERFRHHEGFKELKTIKGRMQYAQKLIEDYTQKIKSGEIGFVDLIEYQGLVELWRFRNLCYNSKNNLRFHKILYIRFY
jgi:hypothetical protein